MSKERFVVETKGFHGPMKVETVLDGDKIVSVAAVEHRETEGIGTRAIDNIPKKMIKNNSFSVDALSGATVTSNGIKKAVEEAIAEAGADIAHFDKGEEKPAPESQIYETDVVVIGSGIAGLASAIEAKDKGAEVLVLEKLGLPGGSSAMCGGKVLAAESYISEKVGEQTTTKELADYFYEVSEEEGDRTFIDYIAEESPHTIQWMTDNGVQFKEELEKLHSSHVHATGHMTTNDFGTGFTEPLFEALKKRGVDVLLNTTVESLIVEEGVVTGVKASDNIGNDIKVNAKAVVIASGGFNQNPEMIKQHHPYLDVYYSNGAKGNTGDGIQMGEEVGAETLFRDGAINLAVNIPTMYGYMEGYKGLYVSEEGKRFIDETSFHFVRSRIMRDRDETVLYAITTESNELVEASVQIGQAFVANSLEELGQKIADNQAEGEKSFDSNELLQAVARYNELAESGKDEDFGKDANYLEPVKGDRYYGLRMMTSNSGTHGGLVVNLDGQVLNKNGEVIEGLYAAGEVADGQYLNIGYPGSGTAISSFATLGRRTGQKAAEEVIQ